MLWIPEFQEHTGNDNIVITLQAELIKMDAIMQQLSFALPRMIWQIVNLFILLIILALPIWLVVKVNSIDKNLKEINKKLE